MQLININSSSLERQEKLLPDDESKLLLKRSSINKNHWEFTPASVLKLAGWEKMQCSPPLARQQRELLPPLNSPLSIADGNKNHFKWARAVFAAGRFLADWAADDFMRLFYQPRRYQNVALFGALSASVAAGLIFWPQQQHRQAKVADKADREANQKQKFRASVVREIEFITRKSLPVNNFAKK